MKFYIRRLLRIWPLYYSFLLITIIIFLLLGQSHSVLNGSMYYYLFFAANIPYILQNGTIILLHYWSIGVEEQFYLIWPWIAKISAKKILLISISFFVLIFLIKIGLWWVLGPKATLYRIISVTRIHCMMVGAAGAFLYSKGNSRITDLLSSKWIQVLSWGFFIIMGINLVYIPSVVSHEAIALFSLSMILGQVCTEKSIFSLENKIFNFIGNISYGIYIIHPLIIFLLSMVFKGIVMPTGIKYILVFASVIASTLITAYASFRFLESPFLKLKDRYALIKNSGIHFNR